VADCVRSIQEVAALGIRFVATTQNIDTDESNPTSRLLLHRFAAFPEFERELIRERVVTGIRAATGALDLG
jgi:DNA invertase Pin-like site-specific DNA recombinase